MSNNKITAVDPAAIDAERERLGNELADMRASQIDAERAVEDAVEAELDLQGRLHAGDDTVLADDMVKAQAEVARARALAHGLTARITRTEKQIERTVVPKIAILVAEVLNGDTVTGLIEWHPVLDVRSADARAILTEAEHTGRRVGVVAQGVTNDWRGQSTEVQLRVQADALTRRLEDSELERALMASNRIGHAKMDTAAQSGQTYRLHVSGVHEDAVPVITMPKYAPSLGKHVSIREAHIGTPTELEDGVMEVEVTAQISPGDRAMADVEADILSMVDETNPAYTEAGVCVESEVLGSRVVTLAEDHTGREVRVPVLDVRQVFRFRVKA